MIAVLGLEEAKFVTDSECEEDANDRRHSLRLENERRAMHRTVVGKLSYMCQERADIMYSVKGDSTNNYLSDRGVTR